MDAAQWEAKWAEVNAAAERGAMALAYEMAAELFAYWRHCCTAPNPHPILPVGYGPPSKYMSPKLVSFLLHEGQRTNRHGHVVSKPTCSQCLKRITGTIIANCTVEVSPEKIRTDRLQFVCSACAPTYRNVPSTVADGRAYLARRFSHVSRKVV